MRLLRKEAGWYQTTIDGHRYDIFNMHGQSVLYSGAGNHWELRKDAKGPAAIQGITVGWFRTFRDARKRLSEIEEKVGS